MITAKNTPLTDNQSIDIEMKERTTTTATKSSIFKEGYFYNNLNIHQY